MSSTITMATARRHNYQSQIISISNPWVVSSCQNIVQNNFKMSHCT